MRRLILLRHGQTEWNAGNRMQGQLDIDLTDLGRAQAKDAARELAELLPVAVVSSDLRRAYDTAVVLGETIGVAVPSDPRLRETHLGQWQGLNHREVDERYPGVRAAWRGDATYAPPGGESRVDVAARAVPVVRELIDADPDWDSGPVVVVAHGGLIAALTAAMLDLPVTCWHVFGGLGNASWAQLSTLGPDAPWRLDVWNRTARVALDVL